MRLLLGYRQVYLMKISSFRHSSIKSNTVSWPGGLTKPVRSDIMVTWTRYAVKWAGQVEGRFIHDYFQRLSRVEVSF